MTRIIIIRYFYTSAYAEEPHDRSEGLPLEEEGQRVMKRSEIVVRLQLGRGSEATSVWTTDLSHDYVSINADYRS